MSKALAIACFMMGKGYGQPCYQYDLEDDTDTGDDLALAIVLVGWASTAVEMVEIAHEFIMEYPKGYEHNIYREFGEWFGEQMSDNDDNEPPTEDECKECLVGIVVSTFNDNLTAVQQDRLTEKLKAL